MGAGERRGLASAGSGKSGSSVTQPLASEPALARDPATFGKALRHHHEE
jgi:hypothetical protein